MPAPTPAAPIGSAVAVEQLTQTPGVPTPQPQIADVFTEPELIREVKSPYPQAALVADVQGDVILEGLVGVDGKVSRHHCRAFGAPNTRRSGAKGLERVSIQAGSSQRDTRTVSVTKDLPFQAGVNLPSHNLGRAGYGGAPVLTARWNDGRLRG